MEKMIDVDIAIYGVHLTPKKPTVGHRMICTVKIEPNGSIARLKAKLIAKGFTHTYDVAYLETVSPVAKLTFVCFLNFFGYRSSKAFTSVGWK